MELISSDRDLLAEAVQVDIESDDYFYDRGVFYSKYFAPVDPLFLKKIESIKVVYDMVAKVEVGYLELLKGETNVPPPTTTDMIAMYGWTMAGLPWTEAWIWSLDAVFGNQLSPEFKDSFSLEHFAIFHGIYNTMREYHNMRRKDSFLPEVTNTKITRPTPINLNSLDAADQYQQVRNLVAVELGTVSYFGTVFAQSIFKTPLALLMMAGTVPRGSLPDLMMAAGYSNEFRSRCNEGVNALIEDRFRELPNTTKATCLTLATADLNWYPLWLIDIPERFKTLRGNPSEARIYFSEVDAFLNALSLFQEQHS